MNDPTGESVWVYDPVGRIRHTFRTSQSTTAEQDYQYNWNGDVVSGDLFAGSGDMSFANSSFDNAGRVATMDGMADHATYTAFGQLSAVARHPGPGNIITTSISYNTRLQFTGTQSSLISGGSVTPTPIMDLTYGYPASPGNSGNPYAIGNNIVASHSQQYSYDSLNRLSSAWTCSSASSNYPCSHSGTLWANTYTYDAFGNLLQKSPLAGATYGESSPNVGSAPSNQLSSAYSYDNAGNMQTDGVQAFTYDAEGRLATGGGNRYLYDGDGLMVGKIDSNSYGTYQFYDPNGRVAIENNDDNEATMLFYFNGQMLERWPLNYPDSQYPLYDALGSARIVLNQNGAAVANQDYYPFGTIVPGSISTTDDMYDFTGAQRDAGTKLNYFGARFYSSTLGRWMSPDPSGLQYADFANPQTLNLYSYVLNNPLIFTDPSGLYCYWDDGSSDDDPKDGGASKGDCGKQGGTWTDQLNPCKGADGCTTTTNNNPAPIGWSDTLNYMDQWKAGTLTQNIMYLQNSGWVSTLRQAPGVNAGYKKYVSGGCKDSSQPFSPGHGAGGTTNAVQAETGDFDMTSSTSGNTVTFTVTNTSGQASWSGANSTGGKGLPFMHSEGTTDNPHGANGPRHNVNQTFVWSEPVPCQGGNNQ